MRYVGFALKHSEMIGSANKTPVSVANAPSLSAAVPTVR
jgi:hypothetical protein